MNFKKKIILMSLTALFFAGCGKNANQQAQNNTGVIILNKGESKTLTLGTSADYPPFEFKRQGDFMGIDIEISRAIAEELGYKLEIADLDFGSLIGAVKSGRVDFIAAALTQTAERVKSIDFSDVYYRAELAAIYSKNGPYNSPEDYEGKKIGVQLGSIMEIYAKKLAQNDPSIKVEALNKNPELIQELKLGRLDVVIIEEAQVYEFAKNNKQLQYNNLKGTGEGYAFGFKKDSPLKNEFNKALKTLKENGTLDEIKKKWISSTDKVN